MAYTGQGAMDLGNRLKGDIAQALIKSLLVAARYRVIDFGVEKTVRELSSLSYPEYCSHRQSGLDGTQAEIRESHNALSQLPDYVVMDHYQTMSSLVEVKYRKSIDQVRCTDLIKVSRQVRRFGEVILILVIGSGGDSITGLPDDFSDHVRCLSLGYDTVREKAAAGCVDEMDVCAGVEVRCRGSAPRSLWEIGRDARDLWRHAAPMSDLFVKFDEGTSDSDLRRRAIYARGLASAMPAIFSVTSPYADRPKIAA